MAAICKCCQQQHEISQASRSKHFARFSEIPYGLSMLVLLYTFSWSAMAGWRRIPCKITELRLDKTLVCGQSFRWGIEFPIPAYSMYCYLKYCSIIVYKIRFLCNDYATILFANTWHILILIIAYDISIYNHVHVFIIQHTSICKPCLQSSKLLTLSRLRICNYLTV